MNPVALPSLPAAASMRQRPEVDLNSASDKFEQMAIDQMLQPLFATVDTDDLFGGGAAEAMFKPMLVTEYATLMEQRGGIGLAPAIERALGDARPSR